MLLKRIEQLEAAAGATGATGISGLTPEMFLGRDVVAIDLLRLAAVIEDSTDSSSTGQIGWLARSRPDVLVIVKRLGVEALIRTQATKGEAVIRLRGEANARIRQTITEQLAPDVAARCFQES